MLVSSSFIPCPNINPLGPSASEYHYLPIPEPVSQSGFYVSTVGFSTTLPHQPYPPSLHPSLYHFSWKNGRTLPEFGFLLITAGKGIFESKETGRVEISSGMGIFTFPGVWHRYRPDPETGWTERWMHFDSKVAQALLDQGIISPKGAVQTLSKPDEVAQALDELRLRVLRTPIENPLLLSLAAHSVLTLALAEPSLTPSQTTEQNKRDPLVDRAMDYIWSRSHHVLAVEDVVAFSGVTRRMLERRIHQNRGHGILHEIIECRFRRAERLLRETDLPITTVVSLAGFGSGENMRTVFIARTALAPAHYRNRLGRSRLVTDRKLPSSRKPLDS